MSYCCKSWCLGCGSWTPWTSCNYDELVDPPQCRRTQFCVDMDDPSVPIGDDNCDGGAAAANE